VDAPRDTQAFAKALRRRLSLPEVLLWRELRGGKLEGLQFRKQHPIGPYVLDFYCAAARLAVEVDGQGHGVGDRPERDERRDGWLADQGIRTFRLRAGYVLETPWDAAQMVLSAARGEV
jgi:very-short-patch-repair endonuclease